MLVLTYAKRQVVLQDDASRFIVVAANAADAVGQMEEHFYREQATALAPNSQLRRQLAQVEAHNEDSAEEDLLLQVQKKSKQLSLINYLRQTPVIFQTRIPLRWAQVVLPDYHDEASGFGDRFHLVPADLELVRFDGLPEETMESLSTVIVLDRLRARGFTFASAWVSGHSERNWVWLRNGTAKSLNSWVRKSLEEITTHHSRGVSNG